MGLNSKKRLLQFHHIQNKIIKYSNVTLKSNRRSQISLQGNKISDNNQIPKQNPKIKLKKWEFFMKKNNQQQLP